MVYAPELYHVTTPLYSMGLSVNADGVIDDVTDPFLDASQSPAAIAGLLPGDRLDMKKMTCWSLNSPACQSLRPVLDFGGEMNFTRAGFTGAYDILAGPEATPRRVTLTAQPVPMADLDRLTLLANTVLGLAVLGAVFFLVWRRPGPMSWGFFLYTVWFNSGQVYTIHVILLPYPALVFAEELMEALAQGAACAGLLLFALRFPENAPDSRWAWAEKPVPWIGAIIAAMQLAWMANLFGYPTGAIANTMFALSFVVDIAALALLLLRLPHLPPQDEQRMKWAISGCVLGIPSFLIGEICQSTSLPKELLGFSPSQSVIELLYLLQSVMVYFVGVAIYRRRVVSVAIPLRRGGTLTVFTFLLGVPILWLHEAITHYTEKRDLPSWIWPFVLGPLVLVLLARLQDMAAEYTEKIFNRRYHRASEGLRKAAQAILRATSFAEIDAILTEAPANALRLASVAVFRMEGEVLHRVGPSIGWLPEHSHTLNPEQYPAFFKQLQHEKPIPLPRNQWNRPDLPRDDLFPCLAVPMRGGVSESIAIIFCGPHRTGSDITHDERELLRDFATHAALSYDRVETNELRQEIQTLREQLAAAGWGAPAPPANQA